jgi:uncharacterized protein YsxB (DUF464 family)
VGIDPATLSDIGRNSHVVCSAFSVLASTASELRRETEVSVYLAHQSMAVAVPDAMKEQKEEGESDGR